MAEQKEKLNLFQRMNCITDELKTVAKNLNVATSQTSSYKAVSERDVLDAVKPLEMKYGVFSCPKNREIIESDTLELVKNYNGKESKSYQRYLRIKTEYVFINTDNPEEKITMISYADGIDSGDKATGKAMTYADKYALMKAYKISTGEDLDAEASPKDGYKKAEGKQQVKTLATKQQIEQILKLLEPERIMKMLEALKVNSLQELSVQQASAVIKREVERNGK